MQVTVLAVGLVLAGCTVDRPSEALRCSVTDDCSGGRTCIAGYCVFGTSADARMIDARIDAPQGVGVACGMATCAAAAEGCCVTAATCRGLTSGCPGGASIFPCDDTADCVAAGSPATDVCCEPLKATGDQLTNASCTSYAACTANAMYLVLCDPLVVDPCPNGGSCTPITTVAELSAYDACQ